MKKVQDFPTEEGWYWFYGDAFCMKEDQYKYNWRMVKVRKISNGLLYIADGNFFANKFPYGYWFKTNPPEAPAIDNENLQH